MTDTSIIDQPIRDMLATIGRQARAINLDAVTDPAIADLLAEHAAAIALLADIVKRLLPERRTVKECPACHQWVEPRSDGTLPGHEINPGSKRSPICRFRGAVRDVAGGEPR